MLIDPSCRSCNSLLDFKAATQSQSGSGGSNSFANMFGATAGATAAANSIDTTNRPKDCPPDSEELGKATWTFLHTMAATYPDTPSSNQQSDMKTFLGIFSKIYPCWYCAEDFQKWMKNGNEPKVQSKEELSNWLCDAHNEVNVKLGKPTFDCKQWRQRWKDGWKDGRCD